MREYSLKDGQKDGKCSRATYTSFMPVSQKEVSGTKAVYSGEEGWLE